MRDHGTALVPGWYKEFIGSVVRQLPLDINSDVADGWINNQEALQKVLREVLLPGCNIYKLIVNYDRSVEDGVRAGRYGWSNPDITSRNFPMGRAVKSKVAVELIHLNRNISTEDALCELDKIGYRPVNLHEILVFGEKYPDVQREFPVVALGAVWRNPYGDRYVPCLSGSGLGRSLSLSWVEDVWGGVCRFAAVRK